MKAQAFLDLVGKMMTKQQDYFEAKRNGLIRAKDLLIDAKQLEKQVRVVLKEGKLEPDFAAEVHVYTTKEYQEQLALTEHRLTDEPADYKTAMEREECEGGEYHEE
jgi:hypothetical protein